MTEHVVLLDEQGTAIGTAPKAQVHHADTPLHLAFSCYVIDRAGLVLLTRRAEDKPTWPGVWTNSCCGHPLPGEPLDAAVRRRLLDELGATAANVELILPGFRYRAVMPNGVVENEMCPVLRTTLAQRLTPDPGEVAGVRWVSWPQLVDLAGDPTQPISPWCRDQVKLLAALGADPRAWPASDVARLPPATRMTPSATGGDQDQACGSG